MAWDQYDNAKRIGDAGAGKGLRGTPRADRIAAALTEVLSPQTGSRCRELAEKSAAAGGLESAAARIVAEAGQNRPAAQ
jgi:UDP:flavonoid glycosyltransferase YjiC (YdhE family)